jgi:hypothetical protein
MYSLKMTAACKRIAGTEAATQCCNRAGTQMQKYRCWNTDAEIQMLEHRCWNTEAETQC